MMRLGLAEVEVDLCFEDGCWGVRLRRACLFSMTEFLAGTERVAEELDADLS